MKLSQAELDDLVRRGAVIGPATQLPTQATQLPIEEPKDVKLIEPGIRLDAHRLEIHLPIATKGEANESKWTRKMNRKLSAKAAVRKIIGPHHRLLTPFAEAYHAGKALRIVFTRLGGRRIDLGNLSVCFKAIEDCIEGALLASDGDPRWVSKYEQSPGPGPMGVRVVIEEYR